MPSAFIRVHLSRASVARGERLNNRASRATLARPDSAPRPAPNAPRAIFACSRNFFRTRHAAAHRDTPSRHAPLSPLPAHPGERAPRPAKLRSNSEFIGRLRTGLLLVRLSTCLLPARLGRSPNARRPSARCVGTSVPTPSLPRAMRRRSRRIRVHPCSSVVALPLAVCVCLLDSSLPRRCSP